MEHGIMKKDTKKTLAKSKGKKALEPINPDAAGIDVGATSHFVAVPTDRDENPIREFKSFTEDLYALSDWLKQCGIKTIAMESTGVYWIPLYELLEEKGFEVKLVDARQIKNVSGRKSDVSDCQWIQQLHTYGLLNGAFRPTEAICALRTYVRQRHMLIQYASSHIQHMHKALTQMNLQIHHVISDITGVTGMKIVGSILAGERNPKQLAQHRDYRCKSSIETIEAALTGHYREEHLFMLKQSLELYKYYQEKIVQCDEEIDVKLSQFASHNLSKDPERSNKKSKCKNMPHVDLEGQLMRLTGINLIEIPGVNTLTALSLIGEIGLDMTRWKNAKQFASWLGLCPDNKISGGKFLGSKTKASANRAANSLRMAATTLLHSATALGAFLRRLRTRIGPAKAITATAHKLAKIIYNMLRYGIAYKEIGQDYYENQYRERVVKNLKNKAEKFGFILMEKVEVLA
jgi:transposase